MPTNKDLKRLVRDRMTETGERYTVALAAVTNGNGNGDDTSGGPAGLVRRARAAGASDVHVDPTGDAYVIRFRIGGRLREAQRLDRPTGAALVADLREIAGAKATSDGKLEVTTHPQLGPAVGRFAIDVDGDPVPVRISFLPTVEGERANLRFAAGDPTGAPGLAALGYSLEDQDRLLRAASWVALIAFERETPGFPPAVAEVVDVLDDGTRSIIVIGPEPLAPTRAAARVRTGLELSLGDAMRSALRSDPDMFVIDGLTSDEDFDVARQLVETGHAVLVVTAPGALQARGLEVVTATDGRGNERRHPSLVVTDTTVTPLA